LFAAPDSAGTGQLYKINTDGTNKRQLTHNTEGPLHNVRLSPDGSFALYTSPGASISIITTVDLSSGQTYSLEGGPLAKNYFPEWSPDSSLVAYSATDFAQNKYLSLIQTDSRTGQHKRTWAVSDCFSTPVTWSPDGNRIAYLSGCGEEERAGQIWTVDLRNPVPHKIVEGGRIPALQWSPPVVTIPRFQIYTNPIYHVSFLYPANWDKVTEERYEGADGFFQISAISSDGPINEVCHSEAFHPLMPYGSKPRIVMSHIHYQEACFIFPSDDQPAEMKTQAALIVKYPHPVQIHGAFYNYFILWADRNHIVALAQGLSFV
jgi:TolB protein